MCKFITWMCVWDAFVKHDQNRQQRRSCRLFMAGVVIDKQWFITSQEYSQIFQALPSIPSNTGHVLGRCIPGYWVPYPVIPAISRVGNNTCLEKEQILKRISLLEGAPYNEPAGKPLLSCSCLCCVVEGWALVFSLRWCCCQYPTQLGSSQRRGSELADQRTRCAVSAGTGMPMLQWLLSSSNRWW